MKYDGKLFRMWKILSLAFSVFIKVYWYKICKKSDREWEQLWDKIGKQFRQTLFELEGLLIKVGQFLSIRADLLPNAFIKQIQDLVDQVPPSPWETIKQELEREWREPIDKRFAFIDPSPVASASIGEVYCGNLLDGTKVAVKVQRPTIRSIVKTDFRSLAIIIWFAQRFAPIPKGFIDFNMLFKELKHVIERELDFQKEMGTVHYFRKRFESVPKLKIPTVYPELCTENVLVMEWIDGERITDVDFIDHHHISRKELSQHLFRVFLPQWLEAGIFHADPHPGNVLVKKDGTLVLLDFGMVGEISKQDATSFQDLLEAFMVKNYAKAVEVLIDLGFLLPEADSKVIEKLLKEAVSIDIAELKEQDLFTIKREMNDIVKSLPIQVPTRFIFLGRSFVTIEGMLHTINPNEEFLEIAKPVFIEWVKKSNLSKWKFIVKWINAQPFFQFFHSITDLLDTPNRILEQKEVQQQREFYFTIYENQKKQFYFLGILGIIGFFLGTYMNQMYISNGSLILTGIALVGYLVSSLKQKKWLKVKVNSNN